MHTVAVDVVSGVVVVGGIGSKFILFHEIIL